MKLEFAVLIEDKNDDGTISMSVESRTAETDDKVRSGAMAIGIAGSVKEFLKRVLEGDEVGQPPADITFKDIARFHKRKFGDIELLNQEAKVDEEIDELQAALDNLQTPDAEIIDEACDVIMAIIGLVRLLDGDIDGAMKRCRDKVQARKYPDGFKHKEEE